MGHKSISNLYVNTADILNHCTYVLWFSFKNISDVLLKVFLEVFMHNFMMKNRVCRLIREFERLIVRIILMACAMSAIHIYKHNCAIVSIQKTNLLKHLVWAPHAALVSLISKLTFRNIFLALVYCTENKFHKFQFYIYWKPILKAKMIELSNHLKCIEVSTEQYKLIIVLFSSSEC